MNAERVLERSQVVPVDVDCAFAFFADAHNLDYAPLEDVLRLSAV